MRWLIHLALWGAFLWFAATVPIGRRTLVGHLIAIARTPEAKDLAEGTKEEAGKVARRIQDELRTDAGGPPAPAEKLEPHHHPAHEKSR